jgi:hypothetical protein
MAKKESATERMAREGGENEARASEDYNRQMAQRKQTKGDVKPAKRAVGRKLSK